MGMSKAEEEEQARLERARAVGLFRYMLIRWTLDRWIRMWQRGGFDALVPAPRQSQPRTPPEVMELAVALKKEKPARTAAQVQRILRAQGGWAPDETTIRRMFRRTGLTALTPAADAPAFGRWEAARPNEIWTGDAMHAIRLQGRKTYLFAFIDDHSRAVMAARFGFAEDTIRLAAALRPALASRGIPAHAYVDNGSAFVDAWLLRACAKLGIKLVHSQPRRPEGKGKIERFFRTVRDGFLVELTEERAARIPDLAELNKLFTAWTETVYHVRVHSETGHAPLARWEAGGPFPLPAQADLAEAFRWSEWRTVSKTALVSLHGNQYQVDPALARRRVELVFDPFDLTVLFVRRDGKDAGTATPHHLTRHSHPKARPEDPGSGDDAPRATGVDYIALLGEQARRTTVDDFRQVIDLSQVTSDDTLLLARTAAEAIRGLNWLTGSEAGLGQPSAAYDVIGALAMAASRLHQALAQITGWLDRALAAGRLGHDLGEDPAEAIDAAGIFLGDAGLSAAALAGDLDAAQQQLALINGTPRNRTRKEQP